MTVLGYFTFIHWFGFSEIELQFDNNQYTHIFIVDDQKITLKAVRNGIIMPKRAKMRVLGQHRFTIY